MHAARYGASCAFCPGVFVSSAATAPLPAAPDASPQPNWSGSGTTGFADQLEQFSTAHDEATPLKAAAQPSLGLAPASRQSASGSKGAVSNLTAQAAAKPEGASKQDNAPSARSAAQTSQSSPTAPPALPLAYTGASTPPIPQIAPADSAASTLETAAETFSSGGSKSEPSQTGAIGASSPAAAKPTRSAGKELEKQSRANPDAIPVILTPISAQPAPQVSHPLSIGLAADADADSDTGTGNGEVQCSHTPGMTSPMAAVAATPLTAALIGEENNALKTTAAGKSSSPDDQSAAPDDLTFAARVQTGAVTGKAPLDSAHRAGAESVQAVRHGGSEAAKDQTSETSTPVPGQPTGAAIAQRFDVAAVRTESNNPVSSPIAQTAPATQPPQIEEAAITKAPLKDISFQVGQAQGQKVEVRVTEQAGELRVAVRAGDSDVAQGLRQGLSDLTTKLTENGYRAETWRPGDLSGLTSASAKEASDTPGQSPNGGSHSQSQQQSQSGSPQQDRGQQNQNPSNRPRWVQELETTLRGGTGSTGDFNGLIS